MAPDKPVIGSVVSYNSGHYVITSVMPRITKYKGPGTETTVIGWTVGLVKLENVKDDLF